MDFRTRSLSRWLVVLTCAVAFLTGAGPLGDVLAFGVHEHIAGDAADGMEPSGMTGVHTAHHHCDLSMSPATVATAAEVLPPTAIEVALPKSLQPALRYTPFVPLTPPRA